MTVDDWLSIAEGIQMWRIEWPMDIESLESDSGQVGVSASTGLITEGVIVFQRTRNGWKFHEMASSD